MQNAKGKMTGPFCIFYFAFSILHWPSRRTPAGHGDQEQGDRVVRPSRCPSREELAAFNLGELPEPLLDAVAAHLEACPRCEEAARALDRVADPVIEALRGSASRTAPPPTIEHVSRTELADRTRPPGGLIGAPPPLAREIRALLQSRLRVLTVVGSAVAGLLLARSLAGQGAPAFRTTAGGLDRACLVLLLAAYLAAAPLVWLRRELPLRALRAVELLLHGLAAGYVGAKHFAMLAAVPAGGAAAAVPVPIQVEHISLLNNLHWFFVLMLYGLLIPNTWRRSLAVLGATALLPFGVIGTAAALNPAVAEQLPAILAVTTAG